MATAHALIASSLACSTGTSTSTYPAHYIRAIYVLKWLFPKKHEIFFLNRERKNHVDKPTASGPTPTRVFAFSNSYSFVDVLLWFESRKMEFQSVGVWSVSHTFIRSDLSWALFLFVVRHPGSVTTMVATYRQVPAPWLDEDIFLRTNSPTYLPWTVLSITKLFLSSIQHVLISS